MGTEGPGLIAGSLILAGACKKCRSSRQILPYHYLRAAGKGLREKQSPQIKGSLIWRYKRLLLPSGPARPGRFQIEGLSDDEGRQ